MDSPSSFEQPAYREVATLPTQTYAQTLLASVLTPAILQEAIDSLYQGVVCFDSGHRLVCFNRRYAELLDLPEEFLQRQPSKQEIVAYQRQRGDFDLPGCFFDSSGQTVHPDPVTDEMPAQYWRSVRSSKTIEVTVSRLPSGLYVRTFSDVSAYWQAQREALKTATRLQRILQAADPGTWEAYLSTGRVEINEAWARMFGYTLDELQPMSQPRWKSMIHQDDLAHIQQASLAFLSGVKNRFDSQFRMQHKAGHWVWVRCTGKNYDGVLEDGSNVISGTLFDISEKVAAQKQSEELTDQLREEVVVQNAQLARSVRDMTQISEGLAHDLRSPLRSINGFASILAEEDTATDPKLVSLYSQKIAELSGKMGRMISGMLELLHVLQQPIRVQPLRASVLAHQSMKALQIDSCFEFICAETPIVSADPVLLSKVLKELLSNALTYTQNSPRPSIEFGYEPRERVYFISDNGTGFDLVKADQLFKPFTRLHPEEPSKGIGMGLAIASRCVERMGGLLWANSSPGKGTTFYFTIGKDCPSTQGSCPP